MVAGAVAGLVASWTMNQFQKVWSAAEEKIAGKKKNSGGGEAEDSTMKTADAIYNPLSQHLYGLASHAVSAVTTEMVRKVVRS